MISIYYAKFPPSIADFTFNNLLHSLPKKEQNKILSIKNWEHRCASLGGKIVLWKGLKNILGNDFNVEIKVDVWGRPYLDQQIDFNISHTGPYIVVGISENNRLGIDVEEIKPPNLADFRNYFHKDEWTIICKATDPLDLFFDYWTAKEAIIKADGRALHLNLKAINLAKKEGELTHEEWQLQQLNLFDTCKSHIAYRNPVTAVKLYPLHI